MATKVPAELSSTPSIVDNGNATAITINSDENVGVGTSIIDTTYSGYVGLELGAQAVINANRTTGDTGVTNIGQNAYLSSASGGSWKYKESGKAALIQGVDDGSIRFLTTDTTGSADDALTWSERARFLSSGGLTFNGDTAAANALDDYEEGVWTPTLNGGTINTIYSAKYTKIGNVVHYYVYLLLSFVNNSNRFEISVPFNTSSVTTETYPVGAIGYSGSMNTQDFRAHVHKGSNPGFIYFHEVDGNATQVTNATMYARNYGDGRVTALIVSGWYYTE